MTDDLIEQFTYIGIFLVLFAAGLGVPIPEEGPILAAAALAHQRIVHWWLALPVCVAGVLAGDTVLYWIGRRWGDAILIRRPVRWIVSPERAEMLRSGYRRHPIKIIVAARHVMGLRAAAFLMAGAVGISFWKFFAANTAAALVSVPLGFGIGYLFVDQIVEIMADVRRIERWLILLGLCAVAAWLTIVAWRRRDRL